MNIKMNRSRNASSPDMLKQSVSTPSSPTNNRDRPEELCLDGCTTTLKLLIKLIQDHNELSDRENNDRKMNRVTGMINILDDVRSRLQRSQSSLGNKRMAELRRCNTDLRPRRPNNNDLISFKDQTTFAGMAARKSLEVMCSSLGKEKEIMATELAKKVHELNEMEEHISDLKTQNEMLLARLQSCNAKDSARSEQGNTVLAEQNRMMSEQLLKALDGFRALKRKLKEARDEEEELHSTIGDLAKEVSAGSERVRGLKHRLDNREDHPVDIDAEISALHDVFKSLDSKFSMHKKSLGRKLN